MINWSTDEKKFKKNDPEGYKLWRVTQLINYGLDGEKISRSFLKRMWVEIKARIDPDKAVYLEYLLWNKNPSSLSSNKNYWQ